MTITANVALHGDVILNAKLINKSTIEGTWQSTVGTGGNLFLANEKEKRADHPVKSKVGDKKTIL